MSETKRVTQISSTTFNYKPSKQLRSIFDGSLRIVVSGLLLDLTPRNTALTRF